jgi:UDP-glucose 4-epimerase
MADFHITAGLDHVSFHGFQAVGAEEQGRIGRRHFRRAQHFIPFQQQALGSGRKAGAKQ